MTMTRARFSVGQVIHHRLFNYRGVIIDVDPEFQGTEEWYQQVARTRPPKNEPWYHVLVHDSDREAYVAERNLESDPSGKPVDHPYTSRAFISFEDGRYIKGSIN
ncbi:MAG: heat shock protein HspQ [Gammaproteobacteria bacterium]|jgi:heat shock protein HspQ